MHSGVLFSACNTMQEIMHNYISLVMKYVIWKALKRTKGRKGRGLISPFWGVYNIHVGFGLQIAFSTSLEGSVIKIKPATLAPQVTKVSLKAKFCHNL